MNNMNEINIASNLARERKKAGVMQGELAAHLGVSKAAVSKWETNQSYPDITLLPKLAAFFGITVDDLVGYEAQMKTEDIRALYHRLSKSFSVLPFDAVMEECEEVVGKYYSCPPLLLQIVNLLINYASASPDLPATIKRAAQLARRAKIKSQNINDAREAAFAEATCYLILGEPEKSLELQDKTIRPFPQDAELLSQTYQAIGNIPKAKEACQISMYQHLILLAGNAGPYLYLVSDDFLKTQEVISRTLGIISLFHLDELQPNVGLTFYPSAAQIYCMHGETDAALDMLEHYTELCLSLRFPLTLHGDEYFDSIDSWFQSFPLGNEAPRSDDTIKKSLLELLTNAPGLANLTSHPRYQNMVSRLEHFLKGES